MPVGKGSLKRVSASKKQEIVNVGKITENNIVEIDVSAIDFTSKRKNSAMKASVKAFGVLMPVIVSKSGDGFRAIDGEKRLTALKELGVKTVKAVIVEGDGKAIAAELRKFAKAEETVAASVTDNIREEKFYAIKRLGEDDFPFYLL